jgi:hypothetical protein
VLLLLCHLLWLLPVLLPPEGCPSLLLLLLLQRVMLLWVRPQGLLLLLRVTE